ncbi:MAG TPA: carboxypeptidase-like regulatory domain-containing protein, partial [Candidatus Thermoplasmatota archaeon]|nr:carboxypeptidase-like regulatory domain-containing protein [Candidatus Thermoplasmatota archaeon]
MFDRRLSLFLVLTLAAAPLLAGCLQQGAVTLEGATVAPGSTLRVVDEAGQPIPLASVTLLNEAQEPLAALSTDYAGNVTLPGVIAATKTELVVAAAGYTTVRIAGGSFPASVTLSP